MCDPTPTEKEHRHATPAPLDSPDRHRVTVCRLRDRTHRTTTNPRRNALGEGSLNFQADRNILRVGVRSNSKPDDKRLITARALTLIRSRQGFFAFRALVLFPLTILCTASLVLMMSDSPDWPTPPYTSHHEPAIHHLLPHRHPPLVIRQPTVSVMTIAPNVASSLVYLLLLFIFFFFKLKKRSHTRLKVKPHGRRWCELGVWQFTVPGLVNEVNQLE